MIRLIRGFALGIFVLTSVSVVPAANAAQPPQGTGGTNPTYLGTVSAARVRTSAEIAAFWTDERMAAAQPLPDSVIDRTAGTGVVRDRLVQADGPAMFVNGYNIAGTETSAVSGTLNGSNSSTPSYTYPFAYNRTYVNIPPMVKTYGKLYFQNDAYGGSFVCSGSSVTSGGGNQAMLSTAGHCLHAGNNNVNGWSYNLLFVPGTQYGSQPFGTWTGYDWGVRSSWYTSANDREDYGFVVTDHNSNVCGALGPCVGAQGLAWNQPVFQQFWSFGYPAQSPFPGDLLVWCTAPAATLDNLAVGSGALPMGIGCDMTGGSSGGPWVISGKVANKGYINSVNTYKYISPAQPEAIYGPYFASGVQSLWDQLRVEVVP